MAEAGAGGKQVLSQSLKPVVDFVVYSVVLSRIQGLATPLTLYGRPGPARLPRPAGRRHPAPGARAGARLTWAGAGGGAGWYAIASMVSTVTLPPFGQLATRVSYLLPY